MVGIVEGVQLTDIVSVDDEGARSAIATVEGRTFRVHNSIVDGFSHLWYEQVHLVDGLICAVPAED